MLVELYCEKFSQRSISFHSGLNVILGDEKATNSIGKSSLLMVLDFAHGGNSLLTHNDDIVTELGNHDYFFVFQFDGKKHVFKRGTETPDLVHSCNQDFVEETPLSVDDYKSIIKTHYGLDDIELTFRSIVSLYSRVWGKDNLDVKQPLHSSAKQKSKECINNLIKLFMKYDDIKSLSGLVNQLSAKKKSINSAYRQDLIPKINKTKYSENTNVVSEINDEIEDIKANLAKYAVSISEIVDREVSDLKQSRDFLLQEKSKILSRLKRVQNDLAKNKHVKSKTFQNLVNFFPDINSEKLTDVEEFHSKITRILKAELKESEKELSDQLAELDVSINSIDERMNQAFSNIDNPTIIIDRVHELSNKYSVAVRENKFFEQAQEVSKALKEAEISLSEAKGRVSKLISDIINDRIRRLVDVVYNAERRSPQLEISESSYVFSAVEDTGTGKAFSNLILMDLAILHETKLPFVIHDTILFKNIENSAVANLVPIYTSNPKQTFIAIDEIQKYGNTAQKILLENKAIQLSDDNLLYVKDWRQ